MKYVLVLAIAIPAASAQAHDAESMPCLQSANTIEKNICLGREVEALERSISLQVARVSALLRKQDVQEPVVKLAPAFESSQAKWQKFQEAECNFRSLSFGSGTGAPAAAAFCKLELGRSRLSYLEGLQ
ncbi:lysozyme inhibitor LprI family protein [Roseateles microcysteis]|uniref:lysozyme inhibitor LprI family protein n=1 Tax=Roseateles microcysteis TaxID=3119057 RepID=UPI002FE5ADF0